ncbi:MAG TPA: hypothetical protein VJM82_08415 [Nitrospiraceae bacterium]|nr:hypothetical protein [Nitrospiraceae bacterium]
MEKLGDMIRPLFVGITVGLVVGILVLDMMLSLDLAAGMFYVALVMISLWSQKRSFTILVAAACTALIVMDFLYSPDQRNLQMTLADRSLALFATWATAILSLLHVRAQQDNEILRALLPMCAGCKRIHDRESGWQFLEQYVRDNSDVRFSRTLCPECRKKWTPRVVGAH